MFVLVLLLLVDSLLSWLFCKFFCILFVAVLLDIVVVLDLSIFLFFRFYRLIEKELFCLLCFLLEWCLFRLLLLLYYKEIVFLEVVVFYIVLFFDVFLFIFLPKISKTQHLVSSFSKTTFTMYQKLYITCLFSISFPSFLVFT